MEAFLSSLGLVAVAEIGDKTQLLSFILAARYPRQAPALIAGILVATLLNHTLAAMVGGWVATHMAPDTMRWILGLLFLAFALWALVPDKLDEAPRSSGARGAFLTTCVLFFLAEMGDKTQVATLALGARYEAVMAVALGTTAGMMLANVPAVLIGERLARRFPLGRMRFVAAGLFALFGVLVLVGVA